MINDTNLSTQKQIETKNAQDKHLSYIDCETYGFEQLQTLMNNCNITSYKLPKLH